MAENTNLHSVSEEFAGVPLVSTAGVFYKDPTDVRFELSLATAEAHRDAGVPYVVVDASPRDSEGSDWVAAAHRRRGAVVLEAEIPGIATQRQQGVAYAVRGGAEKVLGQEPEKTGMPAFATEVIAALDAVDVLVVGRTQRAEDSLPPVQQRTERLAGWILQQTHDIPADALCGPRGFTVAGAEQLSRYPADEPGMNNWIYLYHTPLAARAAGLAIGGITVDLIYPDVMVAEETNSPAFDAKRYMQFRMQLDYLLRRSDVRPEAAWLADFVLENLVYLPENPDNSAYEHFFDELEVRVQQHGYERAAKLG